MAPRIIRSAALQPPPLTQTLDAEGVADVVPGLAERAVRIGRFQVLEVLGRGSMGVVYAAFDEALDRRVALKVIRRDSGRREMVRPRMLREAQALARLSHPNVVQVYEVGEIAGQVFIAMEYLQGGTLREWLTQRPREWPAILDVFVQAGRGLAAAHAARLVHRDFKPENVIVAEDGRVRVVDFGLVRGDGERDDDGEPPGPSGSLADLRITQSGALLGTPAYMSPEQHLHRPVDARSDQFSFCVALWEALYGSRPFAGETREALLVNLEAGAVSPTSSTTQVPAQVHAAIRRGLALAPDARHPAMEALLAALVRDSRRARLWPWLVALLLVVGGLGVGYWSARAAPCSPGELSEWSAERRAALAATFASSELPHAAATSERAAAALDRWAADWAEQSLATCTAHRDGAQSERLFDLRTLCLERRRGELGALLQTLGPGDVAEALQAITSLPAPGRCASLEVLHAEQARTLPPDDPEVAWAVAARSPELERARQAVVLHRDAELGRLLAPLGESPAMRHPPFAAGVHHLKAQLEERRGRYAQSEREARLGWLAGLRGGSLEVAVLAAIARARVQSRRLARFDAAEESLAEAEAVFETLAADPELATSLASARGDLALARGDLATAETWFRRALETCEQVHGADDPRTGRAANDLAGALRRRNRLDEALPLYQRALAIAEAAFGPEHPTLAGPLNNLGNLYYDLQRHAEVQPYYERAYALRLAALGPEHPEVAASLNNLGNNLGALERPAEAAELHARALAIYQRTLGPRHPDVAFSLANGALVVAALGRSAEAMGMLEQALAIQQEVLGSDHPDLATTLNALGNLRFAAGDYAAAAREYERAVALSGRGGASDPSELSLWLYNLGNTLAKLEREADARAVLTRALEVAEGAQVSPRQVLLPLLALTRLELDAGHLPAARAFAARALAGDASELAPPDAAELRFIAARALGSGDAASRAQALTLAREARALLVGLPTAPKLLADVERWLRPREPSTPQKNLR